MYVQMALLLEEIDEHLPHFSGGERRFGRHFAVGQRNVIGAKVENNLEI